MNWEPLHDGDPNRPLSAEIALSETAHIGLTLTSHDPSRNAEARFSHFTTTGNVSAPGSFTQSQDIRFELPPSPDARPRRERKQGQRAN